MSSGKVKCTCGWSWNKSDSSKKDMYICHECGRDNSNNMKNGGWLDNYTDGGTMQEHQENYNDSSVSLPEGFVGMGNNTKGRNYSPAWGGQFQMGGSVYPVNYVPEAQMGRSIGPTPIMPLTNFLAEKISGWFGDDEQPVKKPVAKSKARTLNIVDPRKKMATTNQPLRPNSDLVGGKYNSKHLDKLMQEAKRQGLSKQDMMNLSAMGFQETKWGRSDGNIGHVLHTIDNPGSSDDYVDFVDAYKSKMKLADRLKIKDPAMRLQVYNGLGTITPKTEKNYHGFEMQKIYGVPIPKGGINMKKNPLYGKQVMDIRDNVLAKNPEYLRYMDSIYKAPVPGYMQDARVNKQSRPPGLAMGGSIPGAVGFTYARTQSPAPSNGPYAKKTKASAQNGGTWLGNKLNKQGYITSETKGGNRISFTGNQRTDEWINKQIDSGKFGFDPETGGTFPLNKPVKGLSKEDKFIGTKQYYDLQAPQGFNTEDQLAQIEKLPKWQQDIINTENEKRRKGYVKNNMEEVAKHPLWSPGLFTPEGAVISGLQSGFKVGPDLYEGNYGSAAINTLGALPAVAAFGPELRSIKTSVAPELQQGLHSNGFFDFFKRKPKSDYPKYRLVTDEDLPISSFNKASKEQIKAMQESNIYKDLAKSESRRHQDLMRDIEEYGEGWKYTDEEIANSAKQADDAKASWSNYIDAQEAGIKTNPKFFDNTTDNLVFYKGKGLGKEELQQLAKQEPDQWYGIQEFKGTRSNAQGYISHEDDYIHDTKFRLPGNRFDTEAMLRDMSKDAEQSFKSYYKNQNWKPNIDDIPLNKQGGVIKDDRGQWDHPGEITEINSPYITMQGVPYDVLGISDTGDTKLMKPGKNYKFKGKKVTEYPMAKNGLRQEQKGLVNLDQLTNFTNYNTKQPGGWLDKY